MAAADRPGTAAFEKRVMRFCNGRGFAAGAWKDWDTSSPNWIGRQFGELTSAERLEAERWRDAYLFDLKDRGKDPVTIGNFLRGRMWEGLNPLVLERAEKRKAGALKPDEQAKPEGWAKCLGPTGMAFLFGKLLDGPANAELAARSFLSDPQLREAWPAPWWWQAMLRQKGGGIFDPGWHGLTGAMEPVPQGTAVLAAWKAEFSRRGWPWFAPFDNAPVVYCPIGGPERLQGFEDAMRSQGTAEAAE